MLTFDIMFRGEESDTISINGVKPHTSQSARLFCIRCGRYTANALAYLVQVHARTANVTNSVLLFYTYATGYLVHTGSPHNDL